MKKYGDKFECIRHALNKKSLASDVMIFRKN